MKRKFNIVMIKNSTNVNKTNNHLSPQTLEHKRDHDIGSWKSKSRLVTVTTISDKCIWWFVQKPSKLQNFTHIQINLLKNVLKKSYFYLCNYRKHLVFQPSCTDILFYFLGHKSFYSPQFIHFQFNTCASS